MIRALALAVAAWLLADKTTAPVSGLLWLVSFLSAFVALNIALHKVGLEELL